MNDVKHTALPWRIGDAGHTVFGPPNGKPAPEVVASTTRANAKYIATACNAYPALVEALEQVEQNASHTLDCSSRHPIGECTCFKSIVSQALAQAQGDE